MQKLVILIVGGTLLISAGLIFGGPYLNKAEKQGRIEMSPINYELGDISMAKGLVKKDYKIKNTGSSDLKISKIKTSCMCTTAILKVGDSVSPKFGMNTNFPLWSQKIAPGKTGTLEVTFDPNFHGPDAVGPVVRGIYVYSNDPTNPEDAVEFSGNVVH